MRENLHGTVDTLPHRMFTSPPSPPPSPEFFVPFATFCFVAPFFFFLFFLFFSFFNRSLGEAKNARYFFLTNIHRKSGWTSMIALEKFDA